MTTEKETENLEVKHEELEVAIEDEGTRPLPDSGVLSSLKRQKLKIKEEIEEQKKK
ncbi:MAG: DUF465 domain-containing protein [Alphaproteobacteria bacterium]|nr:DUF465 domain-containing protein [Alphaproteobacteria bacterium]